MMLDRRNLNTCVIIGRLVLLLYFLGLPEISCGQGIECTKGSGQKNLTADEYLQAAKQLLAAGSDGVYLFNFFTSREGGETAYEPPFEVLHNLVDSSTDLSGDTTQ